VSASPRWTVPPLRTLKPGVGYANGLSGDIPLCDLQNGQSLPSQFEASNVGVVYSLALRF
jgi:hypothetical protein